MAAAGDAGLAPCELQAEMGRMPVLPGGLSEYKKLYKWSLEDPDGFWGKVSRRCRHWHACALLSHVSRWYGSRFYRIHSSNMQSTSLRQRPTSFGPRDKGEPPELCDKRSAAGFLALGEKLRM